MSGHVQAVLGHDSKPSHVAASNQAQFDQNTYQIVNDNRPSDCRPRIHGVINQDKSTSTKYPIRSVQSQPSLVTRQVIPACHKKKKKSHAIHHPLSASNLPTMRLSRSSQPTAEAMPQLARPFVRPPQTRNPGRAIGSIFLHVSCAVQWIYCSRGRNLFISRDIPRCRCVDCPPPDALLAAATCFSVVAGEGQSLCRDPRSVQGEPVKTPRIA